VRDIDPHRSLPGRPSRDHRPLTEGK